MCCAHYMHAHASVRGTMNVMAPTLGMPVLLAIFVFALVVFGSLGRKIQ
jgi:hypothetical protein